MLRRSLRLGAPRLSHPTLWHPLDDGSLYIEPNITGRGYVDIMGKNPPIQPLLLSLDCLQRGEATGVPASEPTQEASEDFLLETKSGHPLPSGNEHSVLEEPTETVAPRVDTRGSCRELTIRQPPDIRI